MLHTILPSPRMRRLVRGRPLAENNHETNSEVHATEYKMEDSGIKMTTSNYHEGRQVNNNIKKEVYDGAGA